MTSHIHHAFKRTIWIYRDVVFIVPIMLRRVLRPPGYRNDHLFFRCHGTHITILSWFNSCSGISCPLIPEVFTSGYDFCGFITTLPFLLENLSYSQIHPPLLLSVFWELYPHPDFLVGPSP